VWMGGQSVSEKKRERAVTGLSTRLCGCTAVITRHFFFDNQALINIGSGAVESAVKQIDRRLKISGLLWLMKNVNQMRSLRCRLTAPYPFDAQKRKTGMLQVHFLANFIG